MILDQLEPTLKPHPQSTPGNSLTQLCIQVLILWLLVHTGKAACSTLPSVPCGLGLEEWGNDHASFLHLYQTLFWEALGRSNPWLSCIYVVVLAQPWTGKVSCSLTQVEQGHHIIWSFTCPENLKGNLTTPSVDYQLGNIKTKAYHTMLHISHQEFLPTSWQISWWVINSD